jgi:hypothetical protein
MSGSGMGNAEGANPETLKEKVGDSTERRQIEGVAELVRRLGKSPIYSNSAGR